MASSDLPPVDLARFDDVQPFPPSFPLQVSITKQPEATIVGGQYVNVKCKVFDDTGEELALQNARFVRYEAPSSILFQIETARGSALIFVMLCSNEKHGLVAVPGSKQVLVAHEQACSLCTTGADCNEEDNTSISIMKAEVCFFFQVLPHNIVNSGVSSATATPVSGERTESSSPLVLFISCLNSTLPRDVGSDVSWNFHSYSHFVPTIDTLRILLELLDFSKSLFRLVKKRHWVKVANPEYQEQSVRRIISERKRIVVKNHETKTAAELVADSEPFVQYLVSLLAAQTKPPLLRTQYSNGNSILHYLAWLGLEGPLAFVVERVDVDACNMNGLTPLHAAASQGYKNIVERLLRRKANGDARDHRGESPATYAAYSGFSDISAMLTAYNDTSAGPSSGGGGGGGGGSGGANAAASLCMAAFSGNLEATRQLLAAGHSANEPEPNGAAPVHLAALYGHVEVTGALLDAKADPNKLDDDGTTALHKSAYAGHTVIVELLLRHSADPNIPNRSGALPLHIAAYKNRLECARHLIDAKSKLDVRDDNGVTPLHQACLQDHLELVKLLVASGASINTIDADGASPLQTCCYRGRDDCARALVDHGASTTDLTLLHHVSFFGYHRCLELLLPFFSAVPDAVNNADSEGSTPLHKASFNGHLECVNFLLKHGASVHAVDEEGCTPLHQASFNGHAECARALIHASATVDCVDHAQGTPLHNACFNGHPSVLEVLIQAKADISRLDGNGATPLHLAAQSGKHRCVQHLLQANACLDAQDADGLSVLHHAVEHEKVVRALLDGKANVNIVDLDGRTALSHAVELQSENVVRLLIASSADIELADAQGNRPVDIADGYIKKVLEEAGSVKERTKDSTIRELYEKAAIKFNNKPKEGIEFLMSSGQFSTVEEVAKFLHTAPGLNKVKLGDVIGEHDEFHTRLLHAFINHMDFTGMEFDLALRLFLSKFRLPGEAQKIDRIMESYARHYTTQNPTVFPNEDQAYMLAFSLIMLNTDLHNPSIKNKMTKEQFVKNNTGTGLGEDLPREFLLEIYQRIFEKEIKMEAEEVVFGNSLVQKNGWLTKQGGRIKTWKRRWFILSGNCLYYFKEKQESTSKATGIIPLEDISIRKVDGKKRFCFELYHNETQQVKAMKIEAGKIQKGHHESYFICAASERSRDEWVEAISSNIFSDPYQVLINKKKRQQQALEKQTKKKKSTTTTTTASPTAGPGSGSNSSGNNSGSLSSRGTPGSTSIIGGTSDNPTVDFKELHSFATMCHVLSSEGQPGLTSTYGKWALIEPPFHDYALFFLVAHPTKVQTIVISAVKWRSAAALQSDIATHGYELPEFYNVSAAVEHLRERVFQLLRKDFLTNIVGHCLGGTVAVRLGGMLHKRGFKLGSVVTFGHPSDLQDRELDALAALPIVRVTLPADPIPTLFPSCPQVGSVVALEADLQYWVTQASAHNEALLDSLTEPRLAFNQMDAYYQAIKARHEQTPVRIEPPASQATVQFRTSAPTVVSKGAGTRDRTMSRFRSLSGKKSHRASSSVGTLFMHLDE